MKKCIFTHFKVGLASLFILIFNPLCAAELGHVRAADCMRVDPYPSELTQINRWDDSQFGQAKFLARDNNRLDVYFYVPSQFNSHTPVVFVMHGSQRNALDYLQTFAPIAELYQVFAIAPEFPDNLYPGSEDYNTGVGTDGVPYGGTYSASEWKAEEDYLYSEIEHLFESAKQLLNLTSCGYYIVGHSAGGQFIHRLITFLPHARVIRAVAANSGWYTLASKGNGMDINYYMPYGIQGSPLENSDLIGSFSQELTILVGENDTRSSSQDSSVRNTTEANYQGNNRNQRGQFYYQAAVSESLALSTALNWRFDEVPQAGHDFAQMVQSAVWYLSHGKNETACESSSASQATALVINEIHADPAFGSSGDANGDSYRDSSDDEFVELVNNGSARICLSGWTLGDSSESDRHVFPLGTELLPGQAIVIFGGGIPTGSFGKALVQWAAHSGSLSLSNAGDGIRLFDKSGQLARQISWGNCGDMSCADEHISASLEIDGAMNRWPELSGNWQPHEALSNRLFSPGTHIDGVSSWE